MTQEQIDRILNLITQAADRLGFETVRIWPQMVAITFVQSLCWLLAEPVVLGLACLLYLRLFRSWRDDKAVIAAQRAESRYYISGDDSLEMGLIFGGVGLVMLVVVVGCTLPGQLTGVLYPEATTVLRMASK